MQSSIPIPEEQSYAEKNDGVITFHKLLDFIKSPAYYKMKYIDKLIPEEDKLVFLTGKAFEDYLKLGEKRWKEKYEVVKRRTVEGYNDKNENGKYEITEAPAQTILSGIKDFLEQPLANYNPEKSSVYIKCKYKGLVIGGEVDELIDTPFQIHGKNVPGAISDIKTCSSLKTLRWELINPQGFGLQYKRQLAWYQFIQQVNTDELYAGILKVTSKEENPMTEIFFAEPQSLVDHRGWIIENLDRLVEMTKENSFPEFKRDELLSFNDAYPYSNARIQKELTLI